MRQKINDEIKTRDEVTKAIEAEVITSRLVYPSPSTMTAILNQRGIKVTKPTIYRRYQEMGISEDHGLWTRAVQ